jgi:hypothetical protein
MTPFPQACCPGMLPFQRRLIQPNKGSKPNRAPSTGTGVVMSRTDRRSTLTCHPAHIYAGRSMSTRGSMSSARD